MPIPASAVATSQVDDRTGGAMHRAARGSRRTISAPSGSTTRIPKRRRSAARDRLPRRATPATAAATTGRSMTSGGGKAVAGRPSASGTGGSSATSSCTSRSPSAAPAALAPMTLRCCHQPQVDERIGRPSSTRTHASRSTTASDDAPTTRALAPAARLTLGDREQRQREPAAEQERARDVEALSLARRRTSAPQDHGEGRHRRRRGSTRRRSRRRRGSRAAARSGR